MEESFSSQIHEQNSYVLFSKEELIKEKTERITEKNLISRVSDLIDNNLDTNLNRFNLEKTPFSYIGDNEEDIIKLFYEGHEFEAYSYQDQQNNKLDDSDFIKVLRINPDNSLNIEDDDSPLTEGENFIIIRK
jgi:hypothetical protein